MRSFDLGQVRIHKRSRLPHWDTSHGINAVTFNLCDAVPAEHIGRVRNEIRAIEQQRITRFGTLSLADTEMLRALLQRRLQQLLDRGLGQCFMRTPAVAEMVATALEHFDATRYRMFAWCVMPNHVHVIFSLMEGETLDAVIHSWKSYTSKRANQLLGREGRFWQEDYFDRIVRAPSELRRWVDYVVGNPLKAGLPDWPHVRMYPERLAQV